MGMTRLSSAVRCCLWLAACSVYTTHAAVCTSSEISVTSFASSFTVGSPTSTDVTMTIPILFRTSCTYSSFRKSIGLESDIVSSLTVTGGFNTSPTTTLRAQQYSSSEYRFVRFYFPDGALPASGEVFTATISYQLNTPLCRKDSSALVFQEPWTHYWGCQGVDNWVHRLCVPPGSPLPPYSNSVYGAPSATSGSCYQWDHSSAPSTGLSIQLDNTNLAANAPLCSSNSSSGDDNTLVMVLAVCAAVAGMMVIVLLFYVCSRQSCAPAVAPSATQVPMAKPVHVAQTPPANPGSQGFWQGMMQQPPSYPETKAQPAYGAPTKDSV